MVVIKILARQFVERREDLKVFQRLLDDLGFLGYELAGVQHTRPIRKPKGGQLTAEQKQHNRQVAQRRIRCTSVMPADVVATWPGVRSADVVDGHLVIMAEQAESVLRRLLDADPQLADLEVQRAGLAEAFVAMTAPAQDITGSKQEAA